MLDFLRVGRKAVPSKSSRLARAPDPSPDQGFKIRLANGGVTPSLPFVGQVLINRFYFESHLDEVMSSHRCHRCLLIDQLGGTQYHSSL